MAEISTDVIKMITDYIDILAKNNIKISKAYLFGSYAQGTQNKWSDIDIALVSEDFTGNSFWDRVKLKSFRRNISWDLSPMPFLEEDFNNSYFVRDEILAKGIKIL
jgi:predicted nucleotidyltransferase